MNTCTCATCGRRLPVLHVPGDVLCVCGRWTRCAQRPNRNEHGADCILGPIHRNSDLGEQGQQRVRKTAPDSLGTEVTTW